jgi:tRNA-splicing ligase RtcB
MKTPDLVQMGIGRSALPAAYKALAALAAARRGAESREVIASVVAAPEACLGLEHLGGLAEALLSARNEAKPRAEPVPWRSWCADDVEPGAVAQMVNACRIPVAVQGALMPDAHQGYGLPIGGVLATDNAVVPFAVGVDIACRMKLSILDLPSLTGYRFRLLDALETETRFGVGAEFSDPREHPVMDEDWRVTPVTAGQKDKAWRQLGTSGSGNHFAEFGSLDLAAPLGGIPAGRYVALLTHSGSRGAGATVAAHYSKLAEQMHPDLPQELRKLAWLDLDTQEGQDYWAAMELIGRYASANHDRIHHHIALALGASILGGVENHHNFAWRETHGGREVIVHRKGATPAGAGVLGVIPGTMADPAFIVAGKGSAESLESASHGAGRRMSRTEARRRFNWTDARKLLAVRGVELVSGDLDEVPMAYKDIHEVMALQEDLVQVLGEFHPRMVKMAPAGERPED